MFTVIEVTCGWFGEVFGENIGDGGNIWSSGNCQPLEGADEVLVFIGESGLLMKRIGHRWDGVDW